MASAGLLRQFSVTVNKEFSGSDDRLVSAANISVDVRPQGATCAEAKAIATTDTFLTIYNPGRIEIGELVQLNTDDTTTFQIVNIEDQDFITLKSMTGSSENVVVGDRLVPVTKAAIYTDTTGLATKTNPLTTDSLGFAGGYIGESLVDYIVSGSGIVTRLYTDQKAGAASPHFNVTDFGLVGDGSTDDEPSLNRLLQLVSAATPDAGVAEIHFPRGIYCMGSTIRWDGGDNTTDPNSGIRVTADPGTVITRASTWDDSDCLWQIGRAGEAKANYVFEDIIFDGDSYGGVGGETAMVLGRVSDVNTLSFVRCSFIDAGNPAAALTEEVDGVVLGDDAGAGHFAQNVTFDDCIFQDCRRDGIRAINIKDLKVHDSYFEGQARNGVFCNPLSTNDFAYVIKIHHNIFRNSTTANADRAAVRIAPDAAVDDQFVTNKWEQIEVTANDILHDTGGNGVDVLNMVDVEVSGNMVRRASSYGIRLDSCQDCGVNFNRVSDSDGAGIMVRSTGTLQSQANNCLGNKVHDVATYGILWQDQLGGCVGLNSVRAYDGSGAVGDEAGITVNQSGAFLAAAAVIASNSVKDAGGGAGPCVFIDTSVTDTVLCGNALVGGASEVTDNGTRTVWSGNATGALRQIMTLISGVAPLGSARDAWTGTFTTTASPQTVANTNVTTTCRVLLFPTNAAAGAAVGSAAGIYVSAKTNGVSFAVTYTAGAGAIFDYVIIAGD